MSCQFYYDSMIDSEELTYRIIGVPSTGSGEETNVNNAKVIIKDLIREPLSFSVMHSYSNDGSSIVNWRANLQAFLASAGRQYSEFSAEIRKFLASLNIGDPNSNSVTSSDYKKTLSWVDYLKSFESTKISIPLSFSARIYPRIKGRESDGLRDVRAQVNDISECFIGKSGRLTEDNTTLVYYAPHGYVNSGPFSNLKDLKGTLTLMYGKYAVIEGLLLSSYNVTFSREFVRISPDATSSAISPAYADVNFTLIPALALTQNDLVSLLKSDYLASRSQYNPGWLTDASLGSGVAEYVYGSNESPGTSANPVNMSSDAIKDYEQEIQKRKSSSFDLRKLNSIR